MGFFEGLAFYVFFIRSCTVQSPMYARQNDIPECHSRARKGQFHLHLTTKRDDFHQRKYDE